MKIGDQEKKKNEKVAMEKKISRRQWMGSVAGASLIATGISSVAGSETLGYSAQQQTPDQPFDIHQHVVAPIDDNYSEFESAASMISKDYSVRVKLMDANGIGQSVMMPGTRRYRKSQGIESTKKLNDLVADYVAKHSDRFPIGIGTVEPTHGDDSLKELERIAKQLKFRGVVWHHTNCGVPIDDPFMRPILRTMSDLQLIPFIHVSQPPAEAIWMLEDLAEEFPKITFVALDGLAQYQHIGPAFGIAKKHKNILFDTGPTIGLLRESGVERFVKQIGADRMVFGSDLYAMQPSFRHNITLDILKNSQITPEDRAKILYRNARSLFQL
jgi:predicted TIM-barrel fold metal-dependent hydrolase